MNNDLSELNDRFDVWIAEFAKNYPQFVNPMWGYSDSKSKHILVMWPLLGPQVTNVGMTEITYECVILQDLTKIISCNGICVTCKSLDPKFSELICVEYKQKSDTCIEFSLPKYYDPTIYEFHLSAIIQENE